MSAAATATGVYVYGVVRAEELPAVSAEGIAGTSVELLEHDGLAALVSKLPPGDLRVKRGDLNRHLSVLEEAFAETTIVPCAFGTVVDSEADVETALLSGLIDELSRVAEDVVVEPAGEYIALKASFLVPRKRVDKFDARLDEIARREQPRMQFEVIGPLPPTAFTDVTRG